MARERARSPAARAEPTDGSSRATPSSTGRAPARANSRTWFAALFVAAVVLLVFRRAFDGELLNWDDHANFVANTAWQGLSGEHLRWMATTFHMGPYQPLTWLTFGVEHALWGTDAFAFHVTNVIFHALTAVAFFFLARTFLHATVSGLANDHAAKEGATNGAVHSLVEWGALAAALAFAVHPLRVESVAWITERRDVVSGLFYVLTLLFWVRHLASGAPRWGRDAWLACAAYLLALLGKGTGMTLPLALLVLDVFPFRRARFAGGERSVVQLVLEKWPLFVLGAVFAALAWHGQTSLGKPIVPLAVHGVLPRILHTLHGTVAYPLLTLAPVGTSPLHPFDLAAGALDPRFLAAVGSAPLVALVLWMLRARAVLAAWSAFVILALPILGLAQTGPQLMADRYSYLTCMPFALLFGGALVWASVRWPAWQRAFMASALAVCVALGVAAWKLVPVWHDDEALWTRVVQVYPDSVVPRRSLCIAMTERARSRATHDEQLAHMRATAETCRAALEQFDDATIANSAAEVHRSLAELEPERAEQEVEQVLALLLRARELSRKQPIADPVIEKNLAIAYFDLGRLEDARATLEAMASHFPESADAQLSWGQVLVALGRHADALPCFRRAGELAPRDSTSWFHAGRALLALGRNAEALAQFERARELEPDAPEIAFSIGSAQRALGDVPAAILAFERARMLQGRNEEWARVRSLPPPGDPGLVEQAETQLRELRGQTAVPAPR